MLRILLKVLITALVIVGISEVGRRMTWLAAILASLPLSSILAMIWLYLDTQDSRKVADLSTSIVWAILPSFLFFLLLPVLLKSGVRFVIAMPVSCIAMFLGYTGYVWILKKLGVQF